MTADVAFWERIKQGVVGVRARLGDGTGWVALANEAVVTNFHVVGYEPSVTLLTVDRRQVGAKVVYVSTRHDIAVLMPASPLGASPLALGRGQVVAQGQPVVAVGHPFGLGFTVTRGIVSATNREFDGVTYLQTDAALNPGNSGGPLLDEEGRVLAVNTFLRRGQNLGFALPIQVFGHVLARLSLPREEVLAFDPVYRCLGCEAPFNPQSERCVRCGRAVPGTERDLVENFVERDRAATIVGRLLRQLGQIPNQVRVAENEWRIVLPAGDLFVATNERATFVDFTMRVAAVPRAGHEAFYRFLLSYNDRTSGVCRASIAGNVVHLSIREPVEFLNARAVAANVAVLGDHAGKLGSLLVERFGAFPPPHVDEMK
jgi:serine protease Do